MRLGIGSIVVVLGAQGMFGPTAAAPHRYGIDWQRRYETVEFIDVAHESDE